MRALIRAIVLISVIAGTVAGQSVVPYDQFGPFAHAKFGRVYTGSTIPHFAAGVDMWRTDFDMFSLQNGPVPFRMEVFDANGQPQLLELLDDEGMSLGAASVWTGTAQVGAMRLRTTSSGPIRQGYIIIETPGSQDLAVNAVISSVVGGQPRFRTFVPALGRFQRHIRFSFNNAGGLFTGVAYKSEDQQDMTIIARRSDGSEICRDSTQIEDESYEAFLLPERMPCTSGQAGLLEIISDSGGIVAIGLNFDQELRMWTSLPYDVCCLGK
ncbi:MAG: hypothetical protein O2968_21450 [Acidobacteria bacterium]|nr:hypothetical protein [Acidobacteriota bacterium]